MPTVLNAAITWTVFSGFGAVNGSPLGPLIMCHWMSTAGTGSMSRSR
jgi:hypothetical protein